MWVPGPVGPGHLAEHRPASTAVTRRLHLSIQGVAEEQGTELGTFPRARGSAWGPAVTRLVPESRRVDFDVGTPNRANAARRVKGIPSLRHPSTALLLNPLQFCMHGKPSGRIGEVRSPHLLKSWVRCGLQM